MPTNAPAPEGLQLNLDEVLTLMVQKRHDEVSDRFMKVLEHFNAQVLLSMTPQQQYVVDQFIKVLLYVLSEPTFVISERYVLRYLSFNHLISNLVAMSGTKTTDAYVQILLQQPDNLVKLLTIYNTRNKLKIDRTAIFNVNPELASTWFAFYACTYYSSLVSQIGWDNLREHFSFTDPRLRIRHQIQETYFGSTYAGGDRDRLMKPIVNQTARESLAGAVIQHVNTDRRKIAVISAFWSPNTSVFRNYSALVRSLKPDFHLTFVKLGETNPPEPDIWDQIVTVGSPGRGIDLSPLQNNAFQVAYFPDIGMSDASVMLANMRIAPIQMCSPGHSVSTHGALVDYFMSGQDCELRENPEQNYSERLVLMPGMGVIHNKPNYRPQGHYRKNEVLLVNLPAWCQKVNHPYVQALKKIQQTARTKFKYRLFSGNSLLRSQDFLPFWLSITEQLGHENIEIAPALPYESYMAEMERAEVSFDAFHFGGCNTVSDSLFIGVPMLCWEGDKWYNRIGAEMLRRCGLPELIATNEAEYIEKAVQLLDDEGYRDHLRHKVSQVNLDAAIYSTDDAKYFKSAVNYLIDKHEELRKDGSRDPVRIFRES